MSLEFSTIALNDIVSLVIDYRGKTPKKLGADWSESGIRALSAKNIKTGKIIREDAIRYVDRELYHKWMKDEIKRNDILITSEAPFGEVFFWDSDEKIVLSQRLFGVRCDENKVDPKFIYFYMTSEMFQWELQSRATGTTVKGLRQPELLKCEIQLPNRDNQTKISYILSNIESKINVLKELNRNLLSIADAVFKKEYRNFEEYQEEDLITSDFGLIPKDWYYKTLDEISDVAIGKTPPRKETEWFSDKEGVKWVSIKDLGNSGTYVFETSEYLTNEAIEKFNVKLIPEDTVILSFKLTVGRLGITTEEMVTNEAIAHFKLDENSLISKEYLYLYLKNFNYEELGSTSSIAKAINSKIVKKIPVLIPSNNKMKESKELFENIFNEIKSNQLEINNLTKLRDTLLPKLMSGEIDVSEINCDMQQISTNNWDNKFTVPLQNNLIKVIS